MNENQTKPSSPLVVVILIAVIILCVAAVVLLVGNMKSSPQSSALSPAGTEKIVSEEERNAFVASNAQVNFPAVTTQKQDSVTDIPLELRRFLTPGNMDLKAAGVTYATTAQGFDAQYTIVNDPHSPLNHNVKPIQLNDIYTYFTTGFKDPSWKLLNSKRASGLLLFEFQSSTYSVQVSYAEKEKGSIGVVMHAIKNK